MREFERQLEIKHMKNNLQVSLKSKKQDENDIEESKNRQKKLI